MPEKEIILKHFNDISTKYDENNKKLYWKLADDLLWEIIKKYIPRNKSITFLELGAGTGEWAYKILKEFDNTRCVLVDFSDNMLSQAELKLEKFKERVKIINSDIKNLKFDELFDIILNIYVLPFFDSADKLIEIVSSHLKSKGISISVGENFYNGLALNILKGNTSEVKNVVEKEIGTLSQYVPQLHFNNILVNDDNKISIIDFEKLKRSFVERELDPINRMSRNPNSFNTNSKIILNDYDFRNIMNFIKNNFEVINGDKFDDRLLLFDCLNSLMWLEKYPKYELYNDILFNKSKKLLR